MCGIFGVLNFDGRPVERTALQAMAKASVHRGPDDEGFYLADGILRERRGDEASLWLSALAAFVAAAGMEALMLFLEGRRPDPTDALIAAAAAALACFAATRLAHWSRAPATSAGSVPPELAPRGHLRAVSPAAPKRT